MWLHGYDTYPLNGYTITCIRVTCKHVSTWLCMHVYVNTNIAMYVCIRVCMNMYVYSYVNTVCVYAQ